MFKLKNKNLNPSVARAFSIGEVMLSVFILGVTMLTILSLYASGLRDFQDERDTVIASVLAQEGVELARNIRDNNWAQRECAKKSDCVASGGNFPDTFANFKSTNDNDCRVDINSVNVTSCGTSKVLNVAGGYYVHSAGTATKFRRTIDLKYAGDDLIVTSFVSWDGSDPDTATGTCNVTNKCVFSQTTLTDWGTGT